MLPDQVILTLSTSAITDSNKAEVEATPDQW